MQYLLLFYENEKRLSQGYDEAEMKAYQAFGKEFAKAFKGSNADAEGAPKTVRGKAATTDGPFAEAKEQRGGYCPVDAADIKEAPKTAARFRPPLWLSRNSANHHFLVGRAEELAEESVQKEI